MTITYLTGLNRLRENLYEPTPSLWSDDELRRYIYEGAKEVARIIRPTEAKVSVTVTLGTQEYTAPTDLIQLHRAEYTITGSSTTYPLKFREYNEMDAIWGTSKTLSRGRPEFLTSWGVVPVCKLILFPTPSANGSLTLYYYNLPPEPTNFTSNTLNTVAIPVPQGWEDITLTYGEMRALRARGQARWRELEEEWFRKLTHLEALTDAHHDQPGTITPEVPMLPGWAYSGPWY